MALGVGVRVVGSRGWFGLGLGVVWSGVSRCHSIDQLPKLWLLHLIWFLPGLISSTALAVDD